MSKLLNPVVIIILAILGLAGGFGFSLFQMGYFGKKEPSAEEQAHATHPDTPEAGTSAWTRNELQRLQGLATEMDRWSADLRKKTAELDEQEAALKKERDNFLQEKATLEKIKSEIEFMKKDLDSRLQLVESSQDANIQQLTRLYGSMSVENAAKILGKLPDSQAIQIFRKTKDDRNAKILEEWTKKGGEQAEKANRIISLLRVTIQPEESTP